MTDEDAAERMARGIYFAHTEGEDKCPGCLACRGDVEIIAAAARKKARAEAGKGVVDEAATPAEETKG